MGAQGRISGAIHPSTRRLSAVESKGFFFPLRGFFFSLNIIPFCSPAALSLRTRAAPRFFVSLAASPRPPPPRTASAPLPPTQRPATAVLTPAPTGCRSMLHPRPGAPDGGTAARWTASRPPWSTGRCRPAAITLAAAGAGTRAGRRRPRHRDVAVVERAPPTRSTPRQPPPPWSGDGVAEAIQASGLAAAQAGRGGRTTAWKKGRAGGIGVYLRSRWSRAAPPQRLLFVQVGEGRVGGEAPVSVFCLCMGQGRVGGGGRRPDVGVRPRRNAPSRFV